MGYLIPLIGRSAPEQNVGGGYNKPAPAHSDAPINGFARNYLDSVSTRGSAPARTNLLPKGRTSRRQFLRSRPRAGTGLSPLTAWKPFPWNRSDLACRTIGNGAVYTLGTAAKAAGVSKSTVHRAIRTGKISARSKDGAGYEIDPAEFHRVFPLLSKEVAEQCSDETETGSIERSGTGGVGWKSGSGTAVPVTEHL